MFQIIECLNQAHTDIMLTQLPEAILKSRFFHKHHLPRLCLTVSQLSHTFQTRNDIIPYSCARVAATTCLMGNERINHSTQAPIHGVECVVWTQPHSHLMLHTLYLRMYCSTARRTTLPYILPLCIPPCMLPVLWPEQMLTKMHNAGNVHIHARRATSDVADLD